MDLLVDTAFCHTMNGLNQLWQMDIKYGYVAGRDRFFFVLSIIDVFDCVIVDYYRVPVCEAKHACQTLWRALQKRIKAEGALSVIRSDNGSQFVSTLFRDTCEGLEMIHERIQTFEDAYAAVDRYRSKTTVKCTVA